MTIQQRSSFLSEAYEAASRSGHIFPGAAAAEVCVESAWGTSELAIKANNLFGLKKPQQWIGPTLILPTREFISGKWVTLSSVEWPIFPDWESCFTERMATLHRVPRYAPALAAETPEEFIAQVSPVWSTAPNRGETVLSIYRAHQDVLAPKESLCST